MKDTTEGRKMVDKIEKLGNSIIQHGKYNNRVYILKLDREDVPGIIPEIESLSSENGYSKIFAKIPSDVLPFFTIEGYEIEGFVPRFYDNKTDCFFVSRFLDETRKVIPKKELNEFSNLVKSTARSNGQIYKHSLQFKMEQLYIADVEEIARIFSQVFKTYPFPVHNPEYIQETMQGDKTRYFGVRDGEKLIGVSSAETDIFEKNAEMTDFAVLPEYRGQNLAFRLLAKMEQEMKLINIKTVYTIARIKEPGISKTFLKSGYHYSGTLLNNTNISGSIESMNLFYKHF